LEIQATASPATTASPRLSWRAASRPSPAVRRGRATWWRAWSPP